MNNMSQVTKLQLYEAIIQSSDDAIISKTLDGIVTSWNHGAEVIFGYTADEMMGKSLRILFPPGHQEEEDRILEKLKRGERVDHCETERVRKDGSTIQVSVTTSPVYDSDGMIIGASKIARDISEKKRVESRLELAASVFSHAREGIVITDTRGNIIEFNNSFVRMTGFEKEDLYGKNMNILQSGRQPPEFYKAMWQALTEKGHWYGEVWNRRENGESYAVMLTISAVRDAEGKTQSYIGFFVDITAMKEHEKQLEHLAHFDALTNLPNRVLFSDRLHQSMVQCLRRNTLLSVAFIDLDGFKEVNDKYGHGVGDELLINIARGMSDALRHGDSLARIGGDEFVAVLVDLDHPREAEPILQRLLQAASRPTVIGEQQLQVSASIGVTTYPQDGADADVLMRHADQAMYIAKQAGKNRYHLFDVAQDSATRSKVDNIQRIRLALERKEFVLYFQPKVDMENGAVIGAEALIRWRHPERGLLQPADFLPIIEDLPISVDLGEWVMDEALSHVRAWRQSGLNLPISINVGARQLQQESFLTRLSSLLSRYPEIKPAQLELEILETSALENVAHVSKIMNECREMGVGFALDDFGTGYSSMTYLKHLPADLIKIDQSFVRDMLEDADDYALVEGMIGLAKAFRRQVIAEGVESVELGALLKSMGCELAQGFVIARPMPANEIPGWVSRWHPDTAWRDAPQES